MDDLNPGSNDSADSTGMDLNNNIEAHRQQQSETLNFAPNSTGASRLRFAVNGNVRYILQMFHPPFAHTFMQNALHNVSFEF